MLTCSQYKPLGLSRLRKLPWSTQLSARKMGQRDIQPLCTHQLRPFLKCSGCSPLLAHWTLPQPPQVSKHSCYPWLICHRRKQGSDQNTPWKHVERRTGRTLDHTRPCLTLWWSKIVYLFVQLWSWREKQQIKKCFEKLKCCVLFFLCSLFSKHSLRA